MFAHELTNKKVIIHSDNSGAEHGVRRGITREFDHCSLLHQMWVHIARLQIFVWVQRVPTDDNIADLPSRQQYAALEAIQAERREPTLDDVYLSAEAWTDFNREWAMR